MVQFFNRLFNIQTQEWPRLLMLYAMYFLFMAGTVWGGTVVEASFLTQVGLEFLPVAFVVEALVTMVAIAIYSAFVDRVPNDRLLAIILGLGVAITIGGRVILALGFPTVAFPILYLFYLVIANLFPLQWWNYIDEFYDTLTAKRAVPIIASGLQVGTIFAGLTLPFLNRLISPNNVIYGWIFTMIAVVLLIENFPRLVKDNVAGNIQARTTDKIPYQKSVREGVEYISHSRFLLWMAANTLFLTLMIALIGYQSNKILLEELETTERLSNFIARLLSVVNFVMLPIQVFVFSRIVSRIGVEDTNIIYPAGSLGVIGGLFTFPSQLLAGSLGIFDRTGFRRTFQAPVEILMYNTIPLRVKGRVGAVIAGAVQPAGTLIGGVLLLAFLPLITSNWQLAFLLGGVGLAYLLVSIILRRQYTRALIETLEQEDFSFLLNQPKEVNIVDATTVRRLTDKLKDSRSDELTLFVGQLIVQVSGNDAVNILEPYIRSHESLRVRRGLLDILVTTGVRSDAAGTLYLSLLEDPDAEVRRAAAEGIEGLLTNRATFKFLNVALKLLKEDESLSVRAQVMPALIGSGDIFYMGSAFQQLSELLASPDPDHRVIGVRVLQHIHDVRLIRSLLELINDESDEVRLAVALAIERLAAETDVPEWMRESVVDILDGFLHDPVERIRQTAIKIAQDVNSQAAYEKVVPALLDKSKPIRHVTVEALAKRGRPMIRTLEAARADGDPLMQKMAAIALARIHHERYENLIFDYIRRDVDAIYTNQGVLAAVEPYVVHPGAAILNSMCNEQNQSLLDDVYYLLGTLHDMKAVETIAKNMTDPDNRPFAGEAIESISSSTISRLVVALYEPQYSPADLFDMHVGREGATPSLDEVLLDLSGSEQDHWQRMVITYATGEIYTAIDETTVTKILERGLQDVDPGIRRAAQVAQRMCSDATTYEMEEVHVLSTLEKVIFLKQVPLFTGLTVEELKLVAGICEEQVFEKGHTLFKYGDPGDAMYIIVNGKLSIELEDPETGHITRLAQRNAYEFIGEMALFDREPRSADVVAMQDTLTLRLQDDAFMRLTRQSPDLALAVIRVLSSRLRESSRLIADLQKGKDRQLLDIYDRLGDLASGLE